MIVRLLWRHTFHGGDCAGVVYTSVQHEHVARAIVDRVFDGTGARIRPDDSDGPTIWLVSKTLTHDQLEDFQAHIAPMRTAEDHCWICKNQQRRGIQRHEFADTAHSVDHGSPWEIDIGYVENPNQRTLPGLPR